uniref:Uncharacterized protein n=1 Tax=Physcomitrium patens TaxID=3218 RepID=A0A2K1KMP0_PHYPA|nr:hypothetical protein PHYPA_005938 [Physcomitrium patens]
MRVFVDVMDSQEEVDDGRAIEDGITRGSINEDLKYMDLRHSADESGKLSCSTRVVLVANVNSFCTVRVLYHCVLKNWLRSLLQTSNARLFALYLL